VRFIWETTAAAADGFFPLFNEIKAAEGQRLLLHHILSAAK